jgi:site-specific DNA-methyltransferase (adenine-specific)
MKINKIHPGNCFELLADMKPNSVDLCIIDPPWVTALADLYTTWNLQNHDFEVLADELSHVLQQNGQIAVFCDYPTALAIGNAFQKHFRFRYYWAWIKSNGQPISKQQPISNVELILVWALKQSLTKNLTFNPQMEPGKPYRKTHQAGNSTRKKEKSYLTVNNGERFPKQTLYYPSKDNLPRHEKTRHPTQKSAGLIGYIIKTLSNPDGLILDPFSGSGSTAIACLRTNRNFICIEKDLDYYQASQTRLDREISQQRLF